MPVMRGTLSRRVLASKAPGGSITKIRHLDKSTAIEVIRQRNDSKVEVLLAADRASGSWLVPADAIDAITARAMASSDRQGTGGRRERSCCPRAATRRARR